MNPTSLIARTAAAAVAVFATAAVFSSQLLLATHYTELAQAQPASAPIQVAIAQPR